jgi:hypothetical protein
MAMSGEARMKRTSSSLALLLLLAAGVAAQPPQKELRMLVIVDGHLADEESYYKDTLVPYLTEGAFNLVKQNSGAKLVVHAEFLPSTTRGVSNLGLRYNGVRDKCYFDYDDAVLKKVHAKAGNSRPDRYLVILAGNGSGGCADGTTMFVRENALAEVVAHEMGHSIAGLFDEYGADPGVPAECVRWRNCASQAANTPWVQSATLGARPGCLGYSTYMFHAANTCLMITTRDTAFCPVCKDHLSAALTKGVSPRGLQLSTDCESVAGRSLWTPPAPARGVTDGDLEVVAILTNDGLEVLPPVRSFHANRDPRVVTGDVLAVVRMNSEIVAIEPLAMDATEESLLTARSSSGGFERRVPRDARLIRLTLYGVTKKDVLTPGKKLQLVLYRSSDARASFYVDQRTLQILSDVNILKLYDLKSAMIPAL